MLSVCGVAVTGNRELHAGGYTSEAHDPLCHNGCGMSGRVPMRPCCCRAVSSRASSRNRSHRRVLSKPPSMSSATAETLTSLNFTLIPSSCNSPVASSLINHLVSTVYGLSSIWYVVLVSALGATATGETPRLCAAVPEAPIYEDRLRYLPALLQSWLQGPLGVQEHEQWSPVQEWNCRGFHLALPGTCLQLQSLHFYRQVLGPQGYVPLAATGVHPLRLSSRGGALWTMS